MIKIIFLLFILSLSFSITAKTIEKSSVKVLSFNINCTFNNWTDRFNEAIKEIKKIDPDIVHFQEICLGDGQDQITYLKNAFKNAHFFLPYSYAKKTHRAWDKYDEYILSFSKIRPTQFEIDDLPYSPLQRSYIALNIDGYWFINTHLEHREDYEIYRLNQINFLINHFYGTGHMIMGDFNSEPKSKEHTQFLNYNYESFFPGKSALDDKTNKFTYQIDGSFTSPLFSIKYPIKYAYLALNKTINNIPLSDHLAVVLVIDQE